MQYVNVQDVESYLRLTPNRETTELQTVVDAVNTLVSRWCDNQDTEDIRLGALMLAARVFRRRNSPAGVESLGEMGPVYVARRDPDLAMLLGLDTWAMPKVG